MNAWQRSWVPSPFGWAFALAVVLGCAQIPFAGFIADDFIFLGILQVTSPLVGPGPASLYSLADGDPRQMRSVQEVGAFPWFFDPGFRMRFARPLSSALLALDHALFGLSPFGYSVHNVLWYLLLVAGVGLLFAQVLPAGLGPLSAALYAVSGVFYLATYWSACRHNVIAPACVLWAFLAFLAWREKGKRRHLVAALALLALALLAGEAALAALAYPAAYVLFAGSDPWRRRLRILLPLLSILALYLALYRALGFGASGGSEYLDPLSEPGRFLLSLLGRLLGMAAALLVGGAVDVLVAEPGLSRYLPVLGALAVLVLAGMLRAVWPSVSPEERGALRWLGFGALLSCLPYAASMVVSFHLIALFVGGSVLLGLLLSRWRSGVRSGPTGRHLFRVGIALLALFHLGLAPLLRLGAPAMLKQRMFGRLESEMKRVDSTGTPLGERVILVNAPDLVIGFHSYFFRRLYQLPMPRSLWTLSWAAANHTVTRTAEDAIRIDLSGGRIEQHSFPSGKRIELGALVVTVLDADRDGIRAFGCRMDRSLDDPSLTWLAWKEGQLQAIRLPEVGRSVTLPR